MKIVKVTYTTTSEFAEANKANIQAVMAELQELNSPGINYNTCLHADGKTFVHTAFFAAESDQKTLFDLHSFQFFQQSLKSSNPEVAPKTEHLSLVGTSVDIFRY